MTKCKICKSQIKEKSHDAFDIYFICSKDNHKYLKSKGVGDKNIYECIILHQENFDYVFDRIQYKNLNWNAARVEKNKFDIYSDGLKESKCWNSFEIGELKIFSSQNLIAKMDTLLAFE